MRHAKTPRAVLPAAVASARAVRARLSRFLLLIGAWLWWSAAAIGAGFPAGPIRVIVPFSAGGSTDSLGRIACEVARGELKQPCLVEAKPGAASVIASAYVSKSAPDGYTLLLTTSAFSIVPAVKNNIGYEGVAAFAPVGLIGETPNVMMSRTDSRFRNAADFIAAARKSPAKLNYGSSGNGSTTHMAAELMKSMGQLEVTHVPYKGAAPLLTDLLGGQIDVAFTSLTSAIPFIVDGRARALAVLSKERNARLPDVPTLAESGIPGYHLDVWYGVFAPKGTPADVIDKLNRAFALLPKDPGFLDWAAREGMKPVFMKPAQVGEMVRAEEIRWRELARKRNISDD